MSRFDWKWRAGSSCDSSSRAASTAAASIWSPKPLDNRKSSLLYDFFTNCLRHFYAESCLIHLWHMSCSSGGGHRMSARDENRLNLRVPLKF
jgi:hypothetical protein